MDIPRNAKVKVKSQSQIKISDYSDRCNQIGIATGDFLFDYPDDSEADLWTVVKFDDGLSVEMLKSDLELIRATTRYDILKREKA